MNKRQKVLIVASVLIVLTTTTLTTLFSTQNNTNTDKLKVVATFYPLAFFTQEIGGEEVVVKQLIPDNTEVHNWDPSPSDILAINKADVIVYNGADLDNWFEEDILSSIDSSNKIVVKSTENISLLELDKNNSEPDPDHEHEGFYDPHTWISPFVAKLQAQNIYKALIEKDPNNTEYFTEQWQNLKTRFDELDSKYMIDISGKKKSDIFVTHSAFGYLAYRYGFEQHGVIGVSADQQPSVSAYANLVQMMIQDQSYVVYVNPLYSDESAQTLKSELKRLTGQDVQILKLYLMLGKMDGLDYFGQQEKNLKNLKIGLQI
jgi:zinc transport system substrate-binding protein